MNKRSSPVKLLHGATRAIDALNEWIGRGVAWLAVLLVLTTFSVVVLRYVFAFGSIAAQDLIGYLHAVLFTLGAAYTLKHDGHVRVDILQQRLPPRAKAWIEITGTVLLLLPMAGFMFWSSWDYVREAWAIREGSRNPGGLPGVFLIKTVLWIMPGLLILQGLSRILSHALALCVKNAEHGDD